MTGRRSCAGLPPLRCCLSSRPMRSGLPRLPMTCRCRRSSISTTTCRMASIMHIPISSRPGRRSAVPRTSGTWWWPSMPVADCSCRTRIRAGGAQNLLSRRCSRRPAWSRLPESATEVRSRSSTGRTRATTSRTGIRSCRRRIAPPDVRHKRHMAQTSYFRTSAVPCRGFATSALIRHPSRRMRRA